VNSLQEEIGILPRVQADIPPKMLYQHFPATSEELGLELIMPYVADQAPFFNNLIER